MATYWVDPTLSLMDQQELDIAWYQHNIALFLEAHYEADDEGDGGDEGDEDFGDEPWEEGPQTPPFEPQATRRQLVPVGGGLAVSVDETETETDWDDAISSVSTYFTP
jgi:hypothetical protein